MSIFSDIMPCSPAIVSPGFGRTYHLRLQDGRRNQAKNYVFCMLHADALFGLLFEPEGEMICPSETSIDFRQTARYYIPEDSSCLPL
jgi:hypothetical protein